MGADVDVLASGMFDDFLDVDPSLLSGKEFNKRLLQSKIEKCPLPEKCPDDADLSGFEYEDLKRFWKRFQEDPRPVRNSEHFLVAMALAEDGDGEESFYACVEYRSGRVTISVLPEEEVPFNLLPGIECPEESRRTLGTVLKNTEVRIGRNDPCPCGSGKKSKRCCGR